LQAGCYPRHLAGALLKHFFGLAQDKVFNNLLSPAFSRGLIEAKPTHFS